MSNRRFLMLSIALFMLGTLPFVATPPSALASAGISLGFSAPLEHRSILAMLTVIGMLAASLPRDGLILMPVSFTLMIMLGGMLMLDVGHYPALRYFMLGAVLCLGLMIGIAREKITVLMLLVLASFGFQLGGFYMGAIPVIAAPIYYLLGVLLSLGSVLAISVTFGVTLFGDHEVSWIKLKQSPRLAGVRRIFL